MAEWLHLADLSELARRKKKRVVVAGEQIALFFVDGKVCALHDVCVHRQRSLSRDVVLGGAVVCAPRRRPRWDSWATSAPVAARWWPGRR